MKPLIGEAQAGSGINRARRRSRIGASQFQLSVVSAAGFLRRSLRRQQRISGLMQRVFSGTNLVHAGKNPVSDSFQSGNIGGRHGTRTHDLGVANAALSQLS